MKVPEDKTQVNLVTPQTQAPSMPGIYTPKVVPGAFGADAGRALQGLGDLGMKLAEHMQKRQIEKEDREGLKRETAFRKDMQDRLLDQNEEVIKINGEEVTRTKGFLLRQYEHAEGATEEFDQLYNTTIRDQYLGGLNQRQIDKLSPAMDNYYETTRGRVITHEANSFQEATRVEVEANLKQKASDATMIRDKDELSFAINSAKESASIENNQLPPIARKQAEQEIAAQIAEASIISTIEETGDYSLTKDLLDEAKDQIPLEKYNELEEEIKKDSIEMAIANDLSTELKDSTVLKELSKTKGGLFDYLNKAERSKAIKESMDKIKQNNVLADLRREETWFNNGGNLIEKLEETNVAQIIKLVKFEEIDPDLGKDLIAWKRNPKSPEYETDKEIWLDMEEQSLDLDLDLKEFQKQISKSIKDRSIQPKEAADFSVAIKELYKDAIAFKAQPNGFLRAIQSGVKAISKWTIGEKNIEKIDKINRAYGMTKTLLDKTKNKNLTPEEVSDLTQDIIKTEKSTVYPGYKIEDLEFTAEELNLTVKQVYEMLKKRDTKE